MIAAIVGEADAVLKSETGLLQLPGGGMPTLQELDNKRQKS